MKNLEETEVLDIIREAVAPQNGDGFTRPELEELMDCGSARAMRTIKKLIKSGEITPSMVYRANMHGYQNRVKGYILTS